MFRIAFATVAVVGLIAVAPAFGAEAAKVGNLTITGLWTTATPPGAPTATGYLTVANTGNTADRLVEVSSPVAATAMLHQMDITNGIASMRMVSGIDIPAGKTVSLDPTGFHVMFETLSQPLRTGQTLPVTLTFEKAGKVDAVLDILPIGSRGPTP
jgi:copper(I)-binding protein